MTVREALDRAAELRPGCKLFGRDAQTLALRGGRHAAQAVFLRKAARPGMKKVGADAAWSGSTLPDSTELLVPVPYDTLYPHFLCARIDAALGETDRYAGEQAQYNSILSGLAAGLRQENLPAAGCAGAGEEGKTMALANRAGLKNTRTLLRAFGGLNETYSCTEAECSSGKNFSARNFPALSTRIPRRKLRTAAPVNGMYHLNGLLVVEGTNLCYSTDDAPADGADRGKCRDRQQKGAGGHGHQDHHLPGQGGLLIRKTCP